MSSRDGIHWENVQQWAIDGKDDSNNLISIAYGKGLFVAVGGGGWSRESQAGHILVSSDGKDWREVKKMAFRVSPILFGADSNGGRFVAGGPDKTLHFSSDGINWTQGAKIDPKTEPGWAFWFRSGAYGNGTFVFRGNAGNGQKIQWCVTTPDGEHLTSVQTDLPEGTGPVAFGAGKFIMFAPGGICLTSSDGKSWDRKTIEGGEDLQYAIWTGKSFYAGAKKGAFTSPDGVTWTKVADRLPCRALYADDHIFIGSSWPGQMWSSPDGVKWTKGEPLPADGMNAVASNELSEASEKPGH
jgi:hypothetical protein